MGERLHICEKMQIQPAVMPGNMASAALTGDWVSLANYRRCAIVFVKSVGAASQDPILTVQQAKTASGGTAKNLDAITRIDIKQASALTAVGQFTTVTQVAGHSYTSDTGGEDQALWVIDIDADELDTENGYTFVNASLNDPGTSSQLAAVLYLLHDPRYESSQLPSAIA